MEHPAAALGRERAQTSSWIERPRLEARLDEAFGRRLTTIVAGPGYGKSTLLSQWTADLTSCWYTASARDRSVSSLAAGIADVLRDHLPDLPVQFAAALAGGLAELERAELLAALISEPLARSLTHDLVLVLDDAHELAPGEGSLRLIESLCRQAPAALHLVLASRENLPLRVDRLRGQGQVLELVAAELAFTLDEVETLTAATLPEEGDVAAPMLEATGGWPAALRLMMESLRPLTSGGRGHALERLRGVGSPLFSYLAQEVFEREPPEVRALIRTVAPLERFTLELCGALGLVRPHEVVEGLVKRGLFLQEQNDWLSLHALVREFALALWPLDADEERSVQVRAASWFESKGRLEDAVHAFAAASQHSEVARLLAERGSVLLASAGGDSVVRCVEMLPSQYRSRLIEQLLGEALLARSDFDGALAAFDRAGGSEERLDAALAWRIAMTHHLRGDLVKALEPYSRARCDPDAPADEALLLGWAASSHALQDHLLEAAALAGRALELARSSDDARALASAHVGTALVAIQQGRNQLVDDHLNAALIAAERAGDIQQLLRVRTNRASVLVDRGSYVSGLGELELALDRAETVGFVLLGRALMNRGGAHLRLGLLDEAAADYGAVVQYGWDTGSESAAGLMGVASVFCERGDLAPARASLEQALPLAERSGDVVVLASILFHLATVLIDEDPQEAARLAERAAAYESDVQPRAVTAIGWLALARGERGWAAEAARRAAELARRRGDRFALAEALELAVFAAPNPTIERPRLEEALVIWRDLGSRVRIAVAELALARLSDRTEAHAAAERAERRLRSLGVRATATGPAGLLRTIAQPAPVPLKIQTLGGFLVLRDGVPVSLAEWRSRKARDLLKILVARRGRATPRDLLGETLWPDGDPAKLGNRLSVALSTLRAVLDPDKRFDAEYFVNADADRAAIDLARVLVDVEAFLHEAANGLSLRAEARDEEASERLEQAEAAYAGDFLDEDLYADWAVPLREEARAAYIAVAHALAEDAAAAADREGAIRYLLRILGRDGYDETAHLGLVSALEAAGRHGEARRAYRIYVARMEEIGAAPAAFPRF